MAEVAPHEPMAAISDSATISDHQPPHIPTEAASSSDELRRRADYAVAQAISLKQVLDATSDSAITVAGSRLSQLRSASLHGLDEAKGTLELAKNQYYTHENLAIEKIKRELPLQLRIRSSLTGSLQGWGLSFLRETFEFLNIMQVHGFPLVMGMLTHIDQFKDVKKFRKVKSRLKHRFWTEMRHEAKLFYLSGLIHGKYTKREVHNLA